MAYIAMLEATVSKPALVTNEVEKILGRPPQTFADAFDPTATCSPISKETGHVRTSATPLPQAMNRVVKALQRLGVHTGPAMILTVPGRKTGKPRSTPMTPFTYRGDLYTVAGYPGADWAANARAAGAGTLSRGRASRESRSSSSTRSSHGRYCASSRSRFPSASASPNAPGSCEKGPRTSSKRSQANWLCSGSTRELARDVEPSRGAR